MKLFLIFLVVCLFLLHVCWGEYSPPKFVCTPMPLDMDCQANMQRHSASSSGHWVGMQEEAKETILHLRETVVHQKETILDQRETIRELTLKLGRCEAHDSYRKPSAPPNTMEDPPQVTPPGVPQMERMLDSLKDRLEHLQVSVIYQSIYQGLMEVIFVDCIYLRLSALVYVLSFFTSYLFSSGHKGDKQSNDFRVSFPLRTNYMYAKVKRTLHHEIFAFTICLWLKSNSSPGVGTPFSYSVPGQANEVVLIEWGNNPMELLINDKATTLPLSINDAKWHHVCITWSTRDGAWESYLDGVRRGSGENLASWHPIKPGGIFVLGQEQDTLGGRFDASQAFVGEISDFNMWSHILTPGEIFKMAACASHPTGDVIEWAESTMELHGGPCHGTKWLTLLELTHGYFQQDGTTCNIC
uniref:Pentraxin (PTX) domain-containing protein n=1 Tax=Leptobrachium leishanense TaxID=445787 RepID=A0A8C5N2H6_9ANUR